MRPANQRVLNITERPKPFLRVYYGDANQSPDFDPLDPGPSSAYAISAAAVFRSESAPNRRISVRIAA
jgi:hypothetical protein